MVQNIGGPTRFGSQPKLLQKLAPKGLLFIDPLNCMCILQWNHLLYRICTKNPIIRDDSMTMQMWANYNDRYRQY